MSPNNISSAPTKLSACVGGQLVDATGTLVGATAEDIHKIAKIDLIKDRFQILTYKFIDSLKEHSDLFKLQNELIASRIKRGHKTHLDKLISEYAEIYDEN